MAYLFSATILYFPRCVLGGHLWSPIIHHLIYNMDTRLKGKRKNMVNGGHSDVLPFLVLGNTRES